MEQEKNTQHKDSKRVVWDEEKLKQTEKNRGMFQKIDEPKTPYVKRNSGQCSEDEEQEDSGNVKSQDEIEVNHNLQKAKQNLQINGKRKVDINELNASLEAELAQYRQNQAMDLEEEEEQRRKKEQFKKKRAQHYNEFQMIQMAKNNKWQDDQEEEGDN